MLSPDKIILMKPRGIQSICRHAAAVFVAALVAACDLTGGGRPPELLHDGRLPQRLTKGMTPTERVAGDVAFGTVWRDAIRLRGGETHTFPVNDFRAGDFVRVGIREAKRPDGGYEPVTIEWTGGHTARYTSGASGTWQDVRHDVHKGGGTASVRLSSPGDFWLSHLECVPASKQSPLAIVILVDTLRQDHLHCYGYERETSPNIDAFREDSVMFTGLIPSSSWTRPSVASLLTSTYPAVHGAQDRGDRVRDGVQWLAPVFAQHGYETLAILTNPNCISTWGFGVDFQRTFEMEMRQWLRADTDSDAMGLGNGWIRELAHRPYLMYLHAMAPHSPYEPPPPYDTMFGTSASVKEQTVNLYDGEIAHFDALFGETIAELKKLGVYDSSLIVLLSDHGEEFWDHGGTLHGFTLYEEQLRVPLIVKFPGNKHAGVQFDGILEMIDVAPTMLDILGLPAEPRFQGKSFAPYIGTGDTPRPVGYADLQLDDRSMRAARTLTTKLISNAVENTDTYFDLAADPRELTPLDAPPEQASAIQQYMNQTAMLGNSGLHVLITHDSKSEALLTGRLRGTELTDVSLRYPASMSESRQLDDSTFEFSVTFPESKDAKVPSLRWQEAMEDDQFLQVFVAQSGDGTLTEQNYAEVVGQVPINATLHIELSLDGETFPESQTHLGEIGANGVLNGVELRIADLVASPFAFDPAALPAGTAAYVWYLPGPETIADDELDPELRESLEALGYITE
jgi:arylsulfatase A-like enzyme